MHLLQPAAEQRVALAEQNAISQLWITKERCRCNQEAVHFSGVLDGSCKVQGALRGLPGGQGSSIKPPECCKSRKVLLVAGPPLSSHLLAGQAVQLTLWCLSQLGK